MPSPTGILLGGMALLTLVSWLLFSWAKEEMELRVEAEVAAKVLTETLRHQKEINSLKARWKKENEDVRINTQQELQKAQEEIALLLSKAESQASSAPLAFGDDISLRLQRLWCVAKAPRGDNQRTRWCRDTPAETFTGNFALTITVTPELAKEWESLCDDARDGTIGREYLDFCHWSLTGFTATNGVLLLHDLESLIWSLGQWEDWGTEVTRRLDSLSEQGK